MRDEECNKTIKKELSIRMILIFFGIAICMLFIFSLNVNAEGNTITVDDSGGADYEKIQDAINASKDGDTILVYEGTYYENVNINKTLTLIGNGTENTTIDGGGSGDVVKINIDYVNISGFSIKNKVNNDGILINSNNNTIFNCNISDNKGGLWFEDSSNNKILGCKISNNDGNGIFLIDSSKNIISSCIVSNNSLCGIYLRDSSKNNTISNCNMSNNDNSIYIYYSTNNTISGCNISNNDDDSIYILYSTNNTISGCNISNNDDDGIYIWYSTNNTISSCNISNNDEFGIYLHDSSNNIISNNTLTNDGIVIGGQTLSNFIHSIRNNTINDKPFLFYKNNNNLVLNGIEAGQIILANCSNFEIQNININNTDIGIEFAFCENNKISSCNISSTDFYGFWFYKSSNNIISNCNISNNDRDGIYLTFSSNNTFSNCNISNNDDDGIYLYDSSNNTFSNCNISNNDDYAIYIRDSSNVNIIFHNNFINNTNNTYDECSNQWDNGKEGNYWDDYDGEDNDKNGIGDTPYNIPGGDNQDRYPLMEPMEAEETENSKFYGWVNNSRNGEPIDGAQLDFSDETDEYDNSTWSDEDGYYEINVPEGNFNIYVWADGYYDYHDEEIYIGDQETKEYSLSLEPRPPENSSFYGWVNNSEREEPIEEVEFNLWDDEDDYNNRTYTDENGYYEINVPSGDFTVYAVADGFYDYYEEGLNIGDKERLEYSFYLDPKPEENSMIYGWVNNSENGDPIEGVDISIWDDDDYNNWTNTDDKGYYEMNIPDGEYYLYAEISGYHEYYDEGIFIGEYEHLEYSFELQPKEDENSMIYGWVNNSENGKPIEGVNINIGNTDEYDNWTNSDDEGYYEMNVPEGEYYIYTENNGYYEYYDEGITIGEYEQLEYSFELDPKAEENSQFYGWVNNSETGEAIESVGINYWNDDYDNWTGTDKDGYYQINVPEGNYYIDAYVDGFQGYHDEDIEIGEHERMEYSFEMDPKPEENSMIYGWVNNSENGEPIEGVDIGIWDDNDYNNWTNTDDEGYYEINVPEGDYAIYADTNGYHVYYYEWITIGEYEYLEYSFELDPKPEENSQFYGWVNDSETGEPIEGVNIHVWNEDDYDNGTNTDDEGYYEIHVYEGEFNLDFRADGYYDNNTQDVPIGDKVYMEFSVELEPLYDNSTFYGWINNSETGEPIENVQINIIIWDTYFNHTYSEFDGYYELNVPADTYVVYIDQNGYYVYYEEDIWIAEDEILEYSLQLTPKPPENSMFYGWINNSQNGEPIQNANINVDIRDKYHNDTWSDEFGYYEINVIEGTYYFNIWADGFIGYTDNAIYIEDWEKIEISVELDKRPDENSILRGYLKDSETNQPIIDEEIQINSEEYEYGNNTWTDGLGYYEIYLFEGDWEIEVIVEGYIPYIEYLYIEDFEEKLMDIFLGPLPPPNATIKGFLKDELGTPINSSGIGMIFAQNFIYETGNATPSDDTGYFEFNIWSGLNMIAAQVEGYYAYFTIINISNEETLWHNISIYNVRDKDATIMGNVTDEKGDPVVNAIVYLSNNIIGFPFDDAQNWEFSSITDGTGYYEINTPADDYFLLVEYEDNDIEMGLIDEVQLISGKDIYKNIEFEKQTIKSKSEITFVDWNNIKFKNQMPFSMDGAVELARFEIDAFIGNLDGYVSETEADLFEELFRFMREFEDEDEEFDNTSEDNFNVDDIYYIFEEDLTFEDFVFLNFTGSVFDVSPVWIYFEGNQTSNENIEDNLMHTLKVNVTYEKGEDDFGTSTVLLPEGYTMYEYEATENVSIEGLYTSVIILEYIGEINDDELFEWVIIKVSTNTPPTVNAGENQTVNEGDEVEFLGTFSDPDVDDTHTIEWNFGDGETAFGTLNPKHIYDDNGVFIVTLKVTDSFNAFDIDEITITVNNVIPSVDIGENRIIKINEDVIFNGDFADPGIEDTHTIEWDFGDGIQTTGNLTPTHKYTNSGDFEVTLTVTDDDGGIGIDTITVSVTKITEKKTLTLENGAIVEVIAELIGDGDITLVAATNPNTSNYRSIGIFVHINITFDELIWLNITIKYTDLPDNIIANNLKIYYWDTDNSKWVVAENTGVDTQNNLIWANVTHLTVFAPLADSEEKEEYPDVLVEKIIISPDTPKIGDFITITATIKNVGNASATNFVVKILIGDEEIKKATIDSLESDSTKEISAIWEAKEGNYTIKVLVENVENETVTTNNEETESLSIKQDDGSDDTGDDDGFPIIVIIIPIVIIVLLIVIVIMKGKKQEPTSQTGIDEKTERLN